MDFKLERWTGCGNGGKVGGAEAQKCMHGGGAWVSRVEEGYGVESPGAWEKGRQSEPDSESLEGGRGT